MILFFVIILGLLIGSFLTVCIYRVPEGRFPKDGEFEFDPTTGEEILLNWEEAKPEDLMSPWYPPRSFCPSCKNQLLWWHNLPVVSWLLLLGKCYFCKAKIPGRYPLVETITAVTAILSYFVYGDYPLAAVLIFLFCAALIVISFIDYDYFIIPDVISLPATIIGILLAIINQHIAFLPPPFCQNGLECIYGLLAGAGMLLLISRLYLLLRGKDGMGLGDVKLLAMIGAFFGPEAAFASFLFGSFFGAFGGIFSMIFLRKRMANYYLPFGPYLALATFVWLFWLVNLENDPQIGNIKLLFRLP